MEINKKRFRKVREGWGIADNFMFISSIICYVISLWFTIFTSHYFVFLVIILEVIVLSGITKFNECNVYWEELNDNQSSLNNGRLKNVREKKETNGRRKR